MVDATQLCLSCHCTHGGCYATVLVLSLHTMLQDRKTNVFFLAEAFNTHKFHCVFFFEDTNPWKKWDEINIWTNKPYMEFNTLAAFRASSTKCHVNIAQGRNHGRILVFASIQPRTLWLDTVTQWYILTSQALYLKIRVATLEANFMSPVFLSVIPAWTMTQHDVLIYFKTFSPIFNSLRSSLFVPLQWRQSLMRIALLLHYSCRAVFRWNALSINNSSIEKIRNV